MDIKTTHEKYKILGEYFSPDYERDNEVLTEFKENNSNLSIQQTLELINLLKSSSEITDKYFVADLLYLYDSFDKELLELLIETAINHKDPSFNRIFIKPCINAFGFTIVANNLITKYKNGSDSELEGIKRLLYWIRPEDKNESVEQLCKLLMA